MLPGDFQLPKPTIRRLLVLGVLGTAGLAGAVASLAVAAFVISAWMGLPLGVFNFIPGIGGGPDQPIAFPHTVHVQDVGLDCTFCHRNVTIGAAATIPAVGLCMTCHKVVDGGLAYANNDGGEQDQAREEIEKLRAIHARGEPIDWVRVHRVPDHVHFVHEAHIRFFSGPKAVVEKVRHPADEIKLSKAREIDPDAGVGEIIDVSASAVCSTCHGDVASMVKVRQVRELKMGDCVDCHRQNSAPTDCTTCHY